MEVTVLGESQTEDISIKEHFFLISTRFFWVRNRLHLRKVTFQYEDGSLLSYSTV
jgi:hypothetical protein